MAIRIIYRNERSICKQSRIRPWVLNKKEKKSFAAYLLYLLKNLNLTFRQVFYNSGIVQLKKGKNTFLNQKVLIYSRITPCGRF